MEDPFTGKALLSNSRVQKWKERGELSANPLIEQRPITW
jgi:hypothetical protein